MECKGTKTLKNKPNNPQNHVEVPRTTLQPSWGTQYVRIGVFEANRDPAAKEFEAIIWRVWGVGVPKLIKNKPTSLQSHAEVGRTALRPLWGR